MTESEIPYEKHPKDHEPMQENKVPPPSDIVNPEPPEPVAKASKSAAREGGEGGKFKCSVCGKTFNSQAELDMHIKSQHETKKQNPTKRDII